MKSKVIKFMFTTKWGLAFMAFMAFAIYTLYVRNFQVSQFYVVFVQNSDPVMVNGRHCSSDMENESEFFRVEKAYHKFVFTDQHRKAAFTQKAACLVETVGIRRDNVIGFKARNIIRSSCDAKAREECKNVLEML